MDKKLVTLYLTKKQYEKLKEAAAAEYRSMSKQIVVMSGLNEVKE